MQFYNHKGTAAEHISQEHNSSKSKDELYTNNNKYSYDILIHEYIIWNEIY